MAKCLALAAAAVALFALPSAFVPARQGAPAVSPAVAAGVAAGSMALPAWAYDMPDAQILLARVPGGKRTKELGLVVPIPEEDGLTDGQIAALFVVALVGLIAAVDLAKTLYFGINPTKFKTAKGKGSITPFMKRLIENGYWAVVRCCTHASEPEGPAAAGCFILFGITPDMPSHNSLSFWRKTCKAWASQLR